MGILIENLMNEQGSCNNYNIHEICCDIINFNESIIDIENTYQEEYRNLLVEEVMNESVKDNLSKAWKAIKNFFSDLWGKVKNLFSTIIGSILGFGRKIKDFILKLLKIQKKTKTYEDVKKETNRTNGSSTPSLNEPALSLNAPALSLNAPDKTEKQIIEYSTYDFKKLNKIAINFCTRVDGMTSYMPNFFEEFENIDVDSSIADKEIKGIEEAFNSIYNEIKSIEFIPKTIEIKKIDSLLTKESNINLLKLSTDTLNNIDSLDDLIIEFKNSNKKINDTFKIINSLEETTSNCKVLMYVKNMFTNMTNTINNITNIITEFIQKDKETVTKIKNFYK